MKRRKPLRANPATTREWKRRSRQPLRQTSRKRRVVADYERLVRAEVKDRDGGCVLRTIADSDPVARKCWGIDTYHHLHKAGQGGPTTLDNGVCLCAGHNVRVEDEPAWAKRVGLVVNMEIDPGEAWDRRQLAGLIVRNDRP